MFVALFVVVSGDQSKAQTQKDPEQSQDVIAIINGESITVEAYKKETILHGEHIPGRFDSMAQREALLEEMIRFEVLAAKARKAGYDKNPEIVANFKKMMVQKLWQDQWVSMLKKVAITDDEIEQYYNKHLKDYTGPEMAKAAIIYLKFPPKATEKDIEGLKEKAETILKKAKKPKQTILSVDSLAKEYSDDRESKYRGGDIGWVPRGARIFKWDKSVINAIFALKEPGDISPVITTTKGMYLIKLMDKKEGEVRSFAQG